MNYSTIAKGYNELYKEEQTRKLKQISKILKIKKHYKLLDVGCGTGISTNFFDCKTTGIDPCKELLQQGTKNLIQGQAENLPFKDNEFDIVISVTAVHNFKNINKAIKEMKRVLKPKGQLVVSILKRSKKLKEIEYKLKDHFKNLKQIEQEKDIIFFKS